MTKRRARNSALVLEAIRGPDPADFHFGESRAVPRYGQFAYGNRSKRASLGIPKEYFVARDARRKLKEPYARQFVKAGKKSGAGDRRDFPAAHGICPFAVLLCRRHLRKRARTWRATMACATAIAADAKGFQSKLIGSGRDESFGAEVQAPHHAPVPTPLSAGLLRCLLSQAQKVRTLIKRDFDEAFKTLRCDS